MSTILATRDGGYPTVMTIAGTDSSGGAGIQADLKTFTALKCYGTSVITAMTAQNTTGVQAIHGAPPEFVEQQIRSVLTDIDVRAIKTGMLFDAANTRAVAATLRQHFVDSEVPPVVLDPVCVSTSGHTLLHPEAVEVMVQELFPLALLITPNRAEAELLLSHGDKPSGKIESLTDMVTAAEELLALGSHAVLLKGGHITTSLEDVNEVCSGRAGVEVIRGSLLGENMEILQSVEVPPVTLVVDILHQSDGATTLFLRPRIDSTSTHGTGCTLSAALTCALARGFSLVEATRIATEYTHLGIETAFPCGGGYGPLNHLHSISLARIPPPTPSNPHPFTRILIQSTSKIWKEYVEHDFVKQLGMGTLPKTHFVHFIKQDYHYLKYYARAYGLLGAKSISFPAIQSAAQTMLHVVREVGMHASFCANWNITEEELRSTPESAACTAYGAYIMDIGLQGDSSKLIMALAACLLGYGEVGLWLRKEAQQPNSWVKLEGNPYRHWIEDYSGPEYQAAVKAGIDIIEACAVSDPPSTARFEEWVAVWDKCTSLEKGFWDMAMGLL
ncbi:hypothetical protein JAAARDRAFT_33355 [Jaapia argillacea MUCL 33604]|uniref:Pyridoxamine kinase/Phosphomethylpyrimidine kinase domain-containing protein n=1 Tax=Jaapia argillacea MUCL 33604 TaxID=933084 RepID=A0A067Q0X1_9AGAM|nr:hypothetical protein JAAARDRAFT_33355 [Jaapia argillacea MUCL 33604]